MSLQVPEGWAEVCDDRGAAEARAATSPERLAVPLHHLWKDLAPGV